MTELKFQLHERVSRRTDITDYDSPLKHGKVIRRYRGRAHGHKSGRVYPELYDVQWDDGKIEKGFLPHGLEPESECT